MTCSICGGDLRVGSICGVGADKLIWLNEGEKAPAMVFDNAGVLLAKYKGFVARPQLAAHYCAACKKIFIDVDLA